MPRKLSKGISRFRLWICYDSVRAVGKVPTLQAEMKKPESGGQASLCYVCRGEWGGWRAESMNSIRPQIPGRPSSFRPSFCCPSREPWNLTQKSLLPRLPPILTNPDRRLPLVIVCNLSTQHMPLLSGHFLCLCDLPRQPTCPWPRRPGPPLYLHFYSSA